MRNAVPPNIRIIEFFLEPGAYLNSTHAQRNYLSANYTHVAREVMALGVNVIAHLVAKRMTGTRMELSFGSNPDVTPDLFPLIDAARAAGRDIVLIGEVHAQMPFMPGLAAVDVERFDWLIEDPILRLRPVLPAKSGHRLGRSCHRHAREWL